MKKFGTIAKAILTLALSTAVLAACNGRNDDNNNNGYYGNAGYGLNGTTCGQPVPQGNFQPYQNYGARPYSMNRPGYNNGGPGPRGDGRYHNHMELSTAGTEYIGQGGFQNGFSGCGQNEFPACGNAYGNQYQGGLMCFPQNGYNMNSVYGYNYNNGAFGAGQQGGFGQCGTGGFCGQIAQTCVLGMTNGCMNGICIPANGRDPQNGVGICAQQ